MLGRFLLDIIKNGASSVLGASGDSAPLARGEIAAVPDVVLLDEVNCLVKARHGWFLANRYDRFLGKALIRYGECCEVEQEFFASLIGPGDVIIEVGSNIGVHTVGLAKAVGPTGGVIAIEAQPAIFRILCANLALNALSNVTPHACGCGDRKDTMSVPVINYGAAELHNSGGVSLLSAGVGISVPVFPLDDLVENIPHLKLIKIDVEGMEQKVLQGARRIIEKHRPLLYVENDRIEKSKALIEWLMAAGYRLWWHAPSLFNQDNYFGIEENDYPDIVSLNMLCQPKEADPSVYAGVLKEITNPDHHPLRGNSKE